MFLATLLAMPALGGGAMAQQPPTGPEKTPSPAPGGVEADRVALLDALPARLDALAQDFDPQLRKAQAALARWSTEEKREPSITLRQGRAKAVDPAVGTVIDLGLCWLAAHQSLSGLWRSADFGENCGRLAKGAACGGAGQPRHDAGVTALAVLAFLRRGNTRGEGEYAPIVRAGIAALLADQDEQGAIGDITEAASTYDHAIATIALAEALAAEGGPGTEATEAFRELKRATERAVKHLRAFRNPGAAWRYRPNGDAMDTHPNDVSVTGWVIEALVARLPPTWNAKRAGRRDAYFWYHGSRALRDVGGREWSDWKRGLVSVLLEGVTLHGETAGSWDPGQFPWSEVGGRVYSTAILVLAGIEAERPEQ